MTTHGHARDIRFQLHEVLKLGDLFCRPRYEDHDLDVVEQMLDTAEKLADRYFAPHNRAADLNEPKLVDGKVQLIAEVKQAVDAYVDAGFMGAMFDADTGGMQLPVTVTQACMTFFQKANIATSAYPFLTIGAANLIASFGTEEQKERFLKPMVAGRFFGTMALSEPQAGSSLADIRTVAEPQEDGTYRIVGTKQWISAGEHELSENIVHMVLAKIKGAPAGVKGISLFIVPRYRVNDDGSLGDANDVRLVSLLHKMGYRGTTSTILAFGDTDACQGFLVGEPHHGLGYMFQMMNEARIGVGLGAAMLGIGGYHYSLDYARTRLQGRHSGAKDPKAPPVPIIEHADVRRMLLAQKAYTEGALALCLYAARLADETHTGSGRDTQSEAGLMLDVLTPMVKAWPSDWCLKANEYAIQVLGGYGYTRDYPVEQYYRDNRLNPIHEGTNGIQAIDLLGRKVAMENGAGLALLTQAIMKDVKYARLKPDVAPLADQLVAAIERAGEVTRGLFGRAVDGPERMLANASAYLDMMGHTVIGWMWVRQAAAAAKALQNGVESPDEEAFYRGKLQAARWFFAWEMPRVETLARQLEAFDLSAFDMQPAWY